MTAPLTELDATAAETGASATKVFQQKTTHATATASASPPSRPTPSARCTR
jgi:hypothetical protein